MQQIPSLSTFAHRRRLRREHVFTNVVRDNQRYRILAREHLNTLHGIQIWRIIWVVTTSAILAALLHSILILTFGANMLPPLSNFVFSFLAMSMLWVCRVLHRNWGKASQIIRFTTISTSLLIAACCLLLWTPLRKNLKYPTMLYICGETLGSIFLMTNRNQLMGKFLLMLQFLLIILKMDGDLSQTRWSQIYFGFLIVSMLSVIVLFALIIFFLVNVFYFHEPLRSVKNIGLAFIAFHSLSLIVSCLIPVLQTSLILTCTLGGLTNVGNISFNGQFMLEISMFLCRVEPVKSYNQIISLAVLDQKDVDRIAFIRKSENWYAEERKDSPLVQSTIAHFNECQQIHSNPQIQLQNVEAEIEAGEPNSDLEENKCLICFEAEAGVVWMPCGHLTMCEVCWEKMIATKNSNCLLCKKSPEQIYYVNEVCEEREVGSEKMIKEGTVSREVLFARAGFSVQIC